ncbi:MAG: hypothetical protein BAJALOKI1v1_590023 [Promethearchaeota archaeon]|nr:MAG: hypothetical protein BAJALOKI1v1_590023 [Candidatus Lokiarchaeota archaeon]
MSTRPIISYNLFKNKTREDILKIFLNFITSQDEEDRDDTAKLLWRPHLKFFVVRSYDFSPSMIDSKFQKILLKKENKGDSIKETLDRFRIFIKPLNEKSSDYYLLMEEFVSKKKYHFVIFCDTKYWIIITLTNKEDLDKTIFHIIKIIDKIEIIEITPNHLEGLIHSQEYEENIKGFIAKYKPYKSERQITVDVHGGNLNDLNKMRTIFFVEPTQFQFRLQNSPVSVIEGKVFTEGHFSLEKIQPGYHDAAIKTIQNLTNVYEDINNINYEDIELYDNRLVKTKDSNGLTINSWFIIVIKIKSNRFITQKEDFEDIDKITYKKLNNSIVTYFKNRPFRYKLYSNRQYSHILFDKETRNKVQINFEPKDHTIVIYPFKNCNSKTLRDICNSINEVESSLEIIKPFPIIYN